MTQYSALETESVSREELIFINLHPCLPDRQASGPRQIKLMESNSLSKNITCLFHLFIHYFYFFSDNPIVNLMDSISAFISLLIIFCCWFSAFNCSFSVLNCSFSVFSSLIASIRMGAIFE